METHAGHTTVNNDFYDDLGEKWHEGSDHPIAILRAEAASRTPWVISEIAGALGRRARNGAPLRVLDVGCGAGFLTDPLSEAGFDATGIDISVPSMRTARSRDTTESSRFLAADARSLPFADASFDVVCAMDVIEHVERADVLISEGARVLKPGGMFFFHTFNRTLLSWLMAVKGIELFVTGSPKHLHVYRLFLSPRDLRALCADNGMRVDVLRGLAPDVFSLALLKLLLTRRVPEDFRFTFIDSTLVGYVGYARKVG